MAAKNITNVPSPSSEMESRIRDLTGYEERILVKQALVEASWRYRERAKSLAESRDLERGIERDRCLKICAQFPDNRMAQHIAQLIRSEK